MKTFDWKGCFKQHPVFWDLAKEELDKLLDDKLAREVICQPDQVVVREGEPGDSVFFVGQGEVNVVLQSNSGPGTNIAVLGPGEFFGEMAVLEGRPRMATVVARDNCVLLEIDGSRFREFLIRHPEIEFKIAAKLSQRLRDVTEHVLTARFKDVDQKLQLFNTKLESELKVIDASMKATQAVFDQTNKRANEIIESAERSRSRLTMSVTTVAGAIGILVTVLGFLGFTQVNKMSDAMDTYQGFKKEIADIDAKIDTKIAELDELSVTVSKLEAEAITTNGVLTRELRRFHKSVSIPRLEESLEVDYESALEQYEELMVEEDSEITMGALKVVWGGLFKATVEVGPQTSLRDRCFDLLKTSISGMPLNEEQKLISYYLMLSTMVIAGMDEDYRSYAQDYYKSVDDYVKTGESIRGRLRTEFDIAMFVERLRAEDWSEAEFESRKEVLTKIWDSIP
jgi:CRP/FNR family cyclic AMP-dependent transcriptional regulator